MKNFTSFYLFAVLSATALAGSLSAQTVVEPNPIILNDIDVSEFEAVGHAFAINNSQFYKNYSWQRNVIEMTAGWFTAICDRNQCYLSGVSQASFYLDSGESGTMDVHAYPNGIEGGAIIEVRVQNVTDPTDFFIATYYFNQALSVPERVTNKFKVYPNPVVENFTVDGDSSADRLVVFDITGKVVFSAKGSRTNTYNIAYLKVGGYVVKFYDADNNVLSTNVLIKE